MVVQINTTPNELTFEQNQLLVAGSKMTFADIYQTQIGLQLVRGKYYKANEVDRVFEDINRVLKQISEHGHAQHTRLTEVRQEAQEAKDEIVTLQEKLKTKESQFNEFVQKAGQKLFTLQDEVEKLKKQLAESENARFELISQINPD